MKNKKLNKKLVFNRETVAHLNNGSMDDIKGKTGTENTNYMTCDGELRCNTDRTCQDPNCQAMA